MSNRIEELNDLRASITAQNRKLRIDTSRYKSRIKELNKMIEMERWDIQRTNQLINENTEKYIEAGKELQQLLAK